MIKIMKTHQKAVCLCEEFTDFVLQDKSRLSIVTNIDVAYFRVLKQEMEKIGYTVFFCKTFKDINTITVGFVIKK